MKTQFSLMILCFSISAFANVSEMKRIQTEFNKVNDFNRAQSFASIAGKKYKCDEYLQLTSNEFRHYNVEMGFKTKPYSSSGGQQADYLEFSQYRRNNDFKLNPQFGCAGIEFGVNYLEDYPYLHMDNEVNHIGNTNLGDCYTLKFRVKSNKLLAIGIHENNIIHALNCTESN